jgi:predicted membrane protein (TIGR00267 family)
MGFITKVFQNEIVRRYIVMNSFDGALTILGIILANFFTGINEPRLVILPSVGAAIAMCISGVWGAYAAELAELKRTMKELEQHMMRKLHKTHTMRMEKLMAYAVAVVDGLSPLSVSFIIIIPFFLVSAGILSMTNAYYTSLALVVIALFTLGMFAGKTAKENIYVRGVTMLLAGVVISIIFYVLTLTGLI